MSYGLERYREDREDDSWSVDSSHTDTSSIVHSPQRRPLGNASNVAKSLAKASRKGAGPQLLRQAPSQVPPGELPGRVVVLPRQLQVPLPKGVTFDAKTMTFQGLEEVDMSGFDDSDDDEENEVEKVQVQQQHQRQQSAVAQKPPTPILATKKTVAAAAASVAGRPSSASSTADANETHNRRSSMSEFVIDAAMHDAFFESQRRHNVMLLALVGSENYHSILFNGRALINEKFAKNVNAPAATTA